MTGLWITLGVLAIGAGIFALTRRKKERDPKPPYQPPEPTKEPPEEPEEPPAEPPKPPNLNSASLLSNILETAATMKFRPETLIEEYEKQIRQIVPDWKWGDEIPQEFTFIRPAELDEPTFKLPQIRVDWLHGILIAATIIIAAGWYGNAYYHWEPALQRNKAIAAQVNLKNIQRIYQLRDTIMILDGTLDSLSTAKLNSALRLTTQLHVLSTVQDQLEGNDSSLYLLEPTEWNPIDSVGAITATRTRIRVWMYPNDTTQGVLRYGTTPGEYPYSGAPETSFNWPNHHLGIGNGADGPLEPGTTYYLIGEFINPEGKKYRSPEIEAKTLN